MNASCGMSTLPTAEGCTEGQGYLFSQAQPQRAILALLEKQRGKGKASAQVEPFQLACLSFSTSCRHKARHPHLAWQRRKAWMVGTSPAMMYL